MRLRYFSTLKISHFSCDHGRHFGLYREIFIPRDSQEIYHRRDPALSFNFIERGAWQRCEEFLQPATDYPTFLNRTLEAKNLRLKVSFHFPLVQQGEWLGSLSLSKKNTQQVLIHFIPSFSTLKKYFYLLRMFFFVYHLFLGLVYLLFSKLVKSSTCSLKVFLAFLCFVYLCLLSLPSHCHTQR